MWEFRKGEKYESFKNVSTIYKRRGWNGNRRGDSDHRGNIYPIDYSIHYVDIVEKWKIYYCIDRSVYDVQWRL